MAGSSSSSALSHSALEDLVVSVLRSARALGGEANAFLGRGVRRDVLILVQRVRVVYLSVLAEVWRCRLAYVQFRRRVGKCVLRRHQRDGWRVRLLRHYSDARWLNP
jgi:hypothetical protein